MIAFGCKKIITTPWSAFSRPPRLKPQQLSNISKSSSCKPELWCVYIQAMYRTNFFAQCRCLLKSTFDFVQRPCCKSALVFPHPDQTQGEGKLASIQNNHPRPELTKHYEAGQKRPKMIKHSLTRAGTAQTHTKKTKETRHLTDNLAEMTSQTSQFWFNGDFGWRCVFAACTLACRAQQSLCKGAQLTANHCNTLGCNNPKPAHLFGGS